MIRRCTIFGERQSGTTYLERIIRMNFDVDIHYDYGWKHFFRGGPRGAASFKNSDDTLFICIVRNPVDWINSFYRNPHHMEHMWEWDRSKRSVDVFLNNEFYSTYDDRTELMEDRNIYTGERYKNIFELRHTKLRWMIEDLPNLVTNCILVKHEDLLDKFESTLNRIKETGLQVRTDVDYPENLCVDAKWKHNLWEKKENSIPADTILGNPNLIPHYEEKLYGISSAAITAAREAEAARLKAEEDASREEAEAAGGSTSQS